MKPRLIDPRWTDVPAHDPAIKAFFGLGPKDKWPKTGMSTITVQGVEMWVNPLNLTLNRGETLRARCMCPTCHRTMPIGRLNQHFRHVHSLDVDAAKAAGEEFERDLRNGVAP